MVHGLQPGYVLCFLCTSLYDLVICDDVSQLTPDLVFLMLIYFQKQLKCVVWNQKILSICLKQKSNKK